MDIFIALIPALIFFYFFDYRSAVFSRKSFSSCFNFKNWACNQLQSFASGRLSSWDNEICVIDAVSQFIFFLYNNFTYEIFF